MHFQLNCQIVDEPVILHSILHILKKGHQFLGKLFDSPIVYFLTIAKIVLVK